MILLKIKKTKLVSILNILNLICEQKPINQKLENFLLLKKNKKIYFISRNVNINIKIKIKIKIKKIYSKDNAAINFSIKNFIEIIKNFPECIITLIIKKRNIILKNKDIKYSLNIKKTNNYLLLKKKKYIFKITINKNILYELIKSVYFLIKKTTSKETKNTSLISFKKNKMKIISMDNYRLIYNNIKILNKTGFEKNIIIPNKILFVTYNILKFIKIKNILIKINKFQIKLKIKNLKITSKIIKSKYPNWKNNLKKNKNNFFINKKELLLSLKRSISVMEKTNNFSKWVIENNNLKISTEWNSNKGEEIININYCGKNISFGINAYYILELILNMNTEKLQFNFSKKNKFLIISNPDKKNFKYITNIIKI